MYYHQTVGNLVCSSLLLSKLMNKPGGHQKTISPVAHNNTGTGSVRMRVNLGWKLTTRKPLSRLHFHETTLGVWEMKKG